MKKAVENAMENESEEDGVFFAIIKEMESLHEPRALDLKMKLEQGGALDDMDIDFLERVFEDAEVLKPLMARHPEYEALVAQMLSLYHDITSKALENEHPLE